MQKEIPFINREEQLDTIDTLIQEWGTQHMLCIHASGGIGKTRLLQEVRRRYTKAESMHIPLIVAEVIDFDDHAFYIPLNVASKIAQMLGQDVFEPYYRALRNWRMSEEYGASIERLKREGQFIYDAFIACFNTVSSQQRVVLLYDTTDSLPGREIWDYMSLVGPLLHNCVMLIAGRDAHKIAEKLQSHGEAAVAVMSLRPLEEDAGEAYLQQKQAALHVALEPELAQKLLFLARGRPILLDLVVEWRRRGIALDWLVSESLEALQALPDEQKQRRHTEFEKHLVRHIAQTSHLLDWLILCMARVYPLDKTMIARLLAISEDEAGVLFAEAAGYVFVKTLPNGRISLHDEMRRMVHMHVWPLVDPDGDRQRRDSREAARYLQDEIAELTQRITFLGLEEQRARRQRDAQDVLVAFGERERLEREVWVLKEQQLRHTLFADIGEGVHTFAALFDETSRSYRSFYRRMLLREMEHYDGKLSAQHQFVFDDRKVRYLIETGSYQDAIATATAILAKPELTLEQRVGMLIQRGHAATQMSNFEQGIADYVEAEALATKILEAEVIGPEKRIDMLVQRGNVHVRSGHMHKAIADFVEAVEISRGSENLQRWLVRSLHARGWAYRNKGDFDLALDDYLEAYQMSLRLNDLQQTAWMLNNMGYVHALRGDQQAAFENCQTALDLWEQQRFLIGIGATYSTLGEVSWRFNRSQEAMGYYNKAMDIFTAEENVEWLCIVRSGRPNAFLLLGKLDEAEEDLEWAAAHGPVNLQPNILFLRAQIQRVRGNLEQAMEWLVDCRRLSQEINDEFNDHKSFVNIVDLSWEFGEFDRWQEFFAEHEERYGDEQDEANIRLRGSFLRRIGDLAICAGAYDDALKAYREGLSIIARYEVHTPYTIREQLKEVDRRLCGQVSGNVLRRLGGDLARFWSEQREMVAKHPDALLTFYRWEREGEGE